MYKVNCAIVELQIGPDASVTTVLANANGTYDVTRGNGAHGKVGVGRDAGGAAALLAADDPSLVIAALNDAKGRLDKLIAALDTLAAAQEFDTENPR
jgi:hypothetical protein